MRKKRGKTNLNLGLVVTTEHHAGGRLGPVETRDLEHLELVLGRVGAEHLLVLRKGLAELRHAVADLEAQHDVVLHAEAHTDLELRTLLHDDGLLLGLQKVLRLVELENVRGVLLEHHRKLVDDHAARVVLRRHVVGVDAELLQVRDHRRIVLLLLELRSEIDLRGRGGGRGVRHLGGCQQSKKCDEAKNERSLVQISLEKKKKGKKNRFESFEQNDYGLLLHFLTLGKNKVVKEKHTKVYVNCMCFFRFLCFPIYFAYAMKSPQSHTIQWFHSHGQF